MAVKQCTITTKRYEIKVIYYTSNHQLIDVNLLDGTNILYQLHIIDDTIIYPTTKTSEYYSEDFLEYIKSFVDTALSWIEYWEDVLDPHIWSLMELRSN